MAGLQWNCCPWSWVAGGGALGLVEGVAWACGALGLVEGVAWGHGERCGFLARLLVQNSVN